MLTHNCTGSEGSMLHAVDYKLADLLGIAGSTIGIIIAGAILLGGFDAKYVHLFERYRGLTGEYRGNELSDPRRDSLQPQIDNYRRRIGLINIAAACITLALLLFVLTVGIAGLSVIYPKFMALRLAGTVGLIGGLGLIGAAVGINLAEVFLSRRIIGTEAADLGASKGAPRGAEQGAEHAHASGNGR